MADDSDDYRRKADDLLRQATRMTDMRERGRLIDEAAHYHQLALDAREHADGRTNDNDDAEDDAAEA